MFFLFSLEAAPGAQCLHLGCAVCSPLSCRYFDTPALLSQPYPPGAGVGDKPICDVVLVLVGPRFFLRRLSLSQQTLPSENEARVHSAILR